ncbi:MAG: hypothetical protein ACXIUB_08515 [Wenzhouxiangella sp.]
MLSALTWVDSARADPQPGDYFVSLYAGRAAEERMLDILTRYNTGFIDSYLVAVAPGMVLGRSERLRHDLEGQLVYHWGEQHHWEFNLAYLLRWTRFPWNHRVNTTAGIGAGVSWATEVPFIEPRAKELGEEESRQLLGYVAIELEFAPPGESPWSGFVRLHHRSDAFGLFHDKRGGSNFITLGTRRYF